jgi:hypothetical protein
MRKGVKKRSHSDQSNEKIHKKRRIQKKKSFWVEELGYRLSRSEFFGERSHNMFIGVKMVR